MISREEVKHIAKLARLGLGEEEIEKLREDLSRVLDYIDKLKEVEVEDVEPTSHSILVENITREDQVDENFKLPREEFLKLLPREEKGYLKVRSILK